MPFIELHRHERGVSLDSHQQVVEIVGDTPGEGADGLQLLGLQELGFESFAAGDVDDDAANSGDPAFLQDGYGMDEDGEFFSILPYGQVFGDGPRLSQHNAGHGFDGPPPVAWGNEIRRRQALLHLLLRETEQFQAEAVGIGDAAEAVGLKDDLGEKLRQIPELLFAFLQRLFRPPAIGDVACDVEDVRNAAEVDDGRRHQSVAQLSVLHAESGIEILHLAVLFQAFDQPLPVFRVGPDVQFQGGSTEDLFFPVAGDPQESLVDRYVHSVFETVDIDGIGTGIEGLAESFFALGERGLGPFVFRLQPLEFGDPPLQGGDLISGRRTLCPLIFHELTLGFSDTRRSRK